MYDDVLYGIKKYVDQRRLFYHSRWTIETRQPERETDTHTDTDRRTRIDLTGRHRQTDTDRHKHRQTLTDTDRRIAAILRPCYPRGRD